MKALVLGGTGAMGVPVVQILAERGHTVDVTTRSERADKERIHYLIGNAHDLGFIKDVLKNGYDAIMDFMIYTPAELKERADL